VSPGVSQLKPHHITINLPPSDIQRIVQSPPPLLPSQSRVIVTAKASVSDESGRPLNTTQLVTLPLPTIPASYDDYKEGDESFDPFYRDVPKIRKNRQAGSIEKISSRSKRSLDQPHRFVYGVDRPEAISENQSPRDDVAARTRIDVKDFQAIKDSLMKFRDVLFSDEAAGKIGDSVLKSDEAFDAESAERSISLEDLKTEPSRHLALDKEEDSDEEEEKKAEANHAESSKSSNIEISFDNENHNDDTLDSRSKSENNVANSTTVLTERNKSQTGVIDVIILDSDDRFQDKPAKSNGSDAPIEIILEDRTSDSIGQMIAKSDWREQSIVAKLDEKKQSEIPHETPKRKDFGERKFSSRRKSARTRSSRRRISSKIKQQKTRHVEVTEVPREKKTDEMTISSTTPSTTTTTPSISTTTLSTTTTTPSTTTSTFTSIMPSAFVAPFEARIAEQIDSHIFGEAESQTSKEVDTRAVGQRDATYSKSLQDDKGRDAGKSKETMRSFDHQITKYDGKNLEKQRADKSEEEAEERTEPMDYVEATTSSQDANLTEEPRDSEQAGSMEVTKASEEDGYPEELSAKEQGALDDESIANADNEEPSEASEETPNKISHEMTDSREDNSDLEEEPPRQGEEEEHSTNKVTSYEDLDEYQDTTDSSAENARDSSTIQDDYAESMSKEETPTTVDYVSLEEYTDSQEDVTGGTRGTESNTEGVLKFTDELPRFEDEYDEGAGGTLEADKGDADDYVDDNYEPENYKEIETTIEPRESEEESAKEHDETEEDDQDDSLEEETHTERAEGIADVEQVPDSTTTSPSTAMPSTIFIAATTPTPTTSSTTASTTSTTDSTTLSTTMMTPTPTTSSTTASTTSTTDSTMPSTTMMTTTTSRRPMTTTSRGTPPKLFKPIGVRKIYAFIPPTTTPNPVVIKPRLGLYNPKPAKPPRSYNELAPKPVIRKITLPTRKPATTTTTTTTIATTTVTADTVADTTATSAAVSAENPETTTEPMTTTTTESGRSEENVLESKLEPIEATVSLHPPSSDNREKDDQLSSSSEQNSRSPLNSSNDTDARISTRVEVFTPYPLSRLSTLAPPIEQTTREMETDEPTYETTEKVDDIATTIPSTLSPEETSAIESTSSTTPISTEEYPEEAATTLASTKVHQQETTEVPSVAFEQSTSFPTTLATSSVQPKVIASTDPAAIFRPNIRKFMIPRKPVASFNCLEKEMYRFYGDTRDCRLFHYCSPGFTSRQVLDFRFVCEEGTAFDEETRSCRHEVRNRKCRNRSW